MHSVTLFYCPSHINTEIIFFTFLVRFCGQRCIISPFGFLICLVVCVDMLQVYTLLVTSFNYYIHVGCIKYDLQSFM